MKIQLTMTIFVNQSKASTLVGCSRNNFSKMWKKEKEMSGVYSFFSPDGKINIADPEFIEHYGNHIEEWNSILAEKNKNKKTPVKKEPKPKPKKVIKKTPVEKEKPKIKKRTPKQIEQDEIKTPTSESEEMALLREKANRAKLEKIIIDKKKSEMELKKSRAELAEVETLGKTLIGYCIALNQTLLDQPRSFIDEFEMAFKKGKSKTDLTDILRIPASGAIEDTIVVIKKELEKFRRAIRRAEKKREQKS